MEIPRDLHPVWDAVRLAAVAYELADDGAHELGGEVLAR